MIDLVVNEEGYLIMRGGTKEGGMYNRKGSCQKLAAFSTCFSVVCDIHTLAPYGAGVSWRTCASTNG
jgi:hypothetical protein